MPNSPRRLHDIRVKAGKVISRQRYKCKACYDRIVNTP